MRYYNEAFNSMVLKQAPIYSFNILQDRTEITFESLRGYKHILTCITMRSILKSSRPMPPIHRATCNGHHIQGSFARLPSRGTLYDKDVHVLSLRVYGQKYNSISHNFVMIIINECDDRNA